MVGGTQLVKKLLLISLLLCSSVSFTSDLDYSPEYLLEDEDYTAATLGAMASYHNRCGGISSAGKKFVEIAVAKYNIPLEDTHTHKYYTRGYREASKLTCQKLRRAFTLLNMVHMLAPGEHYDD
jgi:hypothetical protein